MYSLFVWEPCDVFYPLVIKVWPKYNNLKLRLTRFVLTILFCKEVNVFPTVCLFVTIVCERAQSASVRGSWKQQWGPATVARLTPAPGHMGPKSIVVWYHLSDCNKLSDYLISSLCAEPFGRKRRQTLMLVKFKLHKLFDQIPLLCSDFVRLSSIRIILWKNDKRQVDVMSKHKGLHCFLLFCAVICFD